MLRAVLLVSLLGISPAVGSTSSESALIAAIRTRTAEVLTGQVSIQPKRLFPSGTTTAFQFEGSFTENDLLRFPPLDLQCKELSAESGEDRVRDVSLELVPEEPPYSGGLISYSTQKRHSWKNNGSAHGDLAYFGSAYIKRQAPGIEGIVTDIFPLARRLVIARERKNTSRYPQMLIGWGDWKYPWPEGPANFKTYLFERIVELPVKRGTAPVEALALAEKLEPSLTSFQVQEESSAIETFTQAYVVCVDKKDSDMLKHLAEAK